MSRTSPSEPRQVQAAFEEPPEGLAGVDLRPGKRRRDAEDLATHLTPRQREVLRHLLRGSAAKEIASSMNISQHTVNEYIKALHRHFGVSSRSELLAMFVPTFY